MGRCHRDGGRAVIAFLLNLLRTPSAFRGDPKRYLRNQIGHAYVVGGGLALLGVPFWLIMALYALWECVQWYAYGAEVWDCLDDASHVALIAFAASYGLPGLIFCHALVLGAGFYMRRSEVAGK